MNNPTNPRAQMRIWTAGPVVSELGGRRPQISWQTIVAAQYRRKYALGNNAALASTRNNNQITANIIKRESRATAKCLNLERTHLKEKLV
ncbi:MAG: hypothetical protein WCH99_12240 [Verrucomicrobiota bacterium]